PDDLEIVPAVGKFHLSAHKLECFSRFSLMFMQGAGHIDGEILETLWAPFNKILPTARSMSLAHRQEVYDNHMRDANCKKLVAIVKSLCKKYEAASEGVNLTMVLGPFEELTVSLDGDKIKQWQEALDNAASHRGIALDIYTLRMEKAPTLAEIRLQLVESNLSFAGRKGSVAWLAEGINIQEAQDALRLEIQLLPSNPSVTQKTSIEVKRQRLFSRITKFHDSGDHFSNGLNVEHVSGPQDNPAFCPHENGNDLDEQEFWKGIIEDQSYDNEDEDISPESLGLWMPSTIGIQAATRAGLEVLVNEEAQLHIGQANDSLERLRTHLGQKSVLYHMQVRSSSSVWTDTRLKNDIKRLILKINKDVQSYHRAWDAMISLGASDDQLRKYQKVSPRDLSIDKEVTEENRFGQGSDVLPWFWHIGGVDLGSGADWTEECKWSHSCWRWHLESNQTSEVFRVSWLKAKARYERWNEELQMVEGEMFWTTLWFKHQEREWERRCKQAIAPGH
ncbi:hypothetical protein SCLCIDRAFT_122156, partial [Scleroderma citrinum Foug A]